MKAGTVLLVEDDDSLRRVVQLHLEKLGFSTSVSRDAEGAVRLLNASPFDVLLTDLNLPGMSGLELLKIARLEHPELAVVMVTAFASVTTAVDAMKAGAYDYITKPLNMFELSALMRRAIDHQHLASEVRLLRACLDQKFAFENIIGSSVSLGRTIDLCRRAADTDATVLITGETGTGKEVLATAIHFRSSRRERPMVTINCGAIPRELLESELFGHLKGSFTGALTHKKGRIEAADGGTVFFDEIGEMPLDLQVRLLRLIQEREIDKIGATQPTRVDVTIVAATHRNLEAMVEQGTFREDLYYRLAVIPIEVQPLRKRPVDIAELVQHFFQTGKQKHGRPDLRFPPELLPFFTAYDWPGNVRQVQNVVERLIVLCDGNEIKLDDLPAPIRACEPSSDLIPADLPPEGLDFEAVEKELLRKALKKFDGNQTRAAAYLKLSRKTFLYRLQKFNIIHDGEDEPEVA